MKKCSMCQEVKPEIEFYKNKKAKDGLAYRCTPCHKKHYGSKEYLKREYNKTGWKRHLKNKYGITPECYDKMFSEQKGSCKICKRSCTGTKNSDKLFVDHCHETGIVRGLLCDRCNRGLGAFQDNVESIKEAIRYLNEYKA